MIMDRRQSRWAVGTSAGAVVSLAVYIVYAVLSPNGARGGSLAGLFFAAMGTGVHTEQSDFLLKHLPNATKRVIHGGAHGYFWQMPDETARAILEWTATH